MTETEQFQRLNKQKRSLHVYWYSMLTGLLVCLWIVYSISLSNKQETINSLAWELDNHYIAERNRLIDIVDQITTLREQKKEVCESIPVEFRTKRENSICG